MNMGRASRRWTQNSRVFRGPENSWLPVTLRVLGLSVAASLQLIEQAGRWADATDIQKYSGIAPVVERSGKSFWVHRRLARPIFICQTFHEFAQQSTQHSSWAEQFYRRQRQRGKSHHSAIRAGIQMDTHHLRLLESQQAL
jgi:hypothetical protein